MERERENKREINLSGMRLPRLRDDRLYGNRYFSLTITRVSHDCPLSLSLSLPLSLSLCESTRCIFIRSMENIGNICEIESPTVRQPPRVVLFRVDLGHVTAEHFVEQREEDGQQSVLYQRKPSGQILGRAEIP